MGQQRYRQERMAPTRHRGLRWRFVTIPVALCLMAWIITTIAIDAGRSQSPYRRTTNQIYAQLAWLIVQRSNQSSGDLHNIRNNATAMSRTALEDQLSRLATTSSLIASQARSIPAPAGNPLLRPQLLAAVRDRSDATRLLKRGIDKILRAGAVSTSSTSLLDKAGRYLARGDAAYARFRKDMQRSPGGRLLPRSAWITNPAAWKAAGLATFAQSIASASNLFGVHDVVLTTASITPSAETSAGGISVLPPTHKLLVRLVIYNNGNLTERKVPIQATLESQGSASGTPSPATAKSETSRKVVALRPTQYLAIDLPALAITPGKTYLLTLQVGPTPSQPLTSSNQETFTIQVAP